MGKRVWRRGIGWVTEPELGQRTLREKEKPRWLIEEEERIRKEKERKKKRERRQRITDPILCIPRILAGLLLVAGAVWVSRNWIFVPWENFTYPGVYYGKGIVFSVFTCVLAVALYFLGKGENGIGDYLVGGVGIGVVLTIIYGVWRAALSFHGMSAWTEPWMGNVLLIVISAFAFIYSLVVIALIFFSRGKKMDDQEPFFHDGAGPEGGMGNT